jgi:hypothetical protein
MQVENMRPVRAAALTCKYVKIEKWNVVALTGRRKRRLLSVPQGDALG